MQFLTSEIKSVNKKVLENISGLPKYYGLTRQMLVDEKKINIEIGTNERVFLDSDYDCFFYHKLTDVSFQEIKAPGKKKLYNALVSVDFVGMSKNQQMDSEVLSALSNYNLLLIKKINYDSMAIANSEANVISYDFSRYLFVISYQIPIKTDNCFELCQ